MDKLSRENKEYLIKRNTNEYEVVIGLEVHAQVLSELVIFNTPTKFGSEPNTQVSLVDAAFPGMLPVINEFFALNKAIKTGIGLNAKINKKSIFDRKNYFYADLPQGYQISQYKNPIVGEGTVTLDLPNGEKELELKDYILSKMPLKAFMI